MNELSNLDWGLLALLLVSITMGAWRGLINEVLSILVWVFAFFSAQWWAPWVLQNVMNQASMGSGFKYAVSFILVFIVSVYVGGMLVSRFKTYTDGTGIVTSDLCGRLRVA